MESSKVSNEVLLQLVTRLENAINKLEVRSGPPVPQVSLPVSASVATTEKVSVFSDYWNKTLKLIQELNNDAKDTGSNEIIQITDSAIQTICAHQDILFASENFKKPAINDIKEVSKKVFSIRSKVEEIGKLNKDYSLHSDAVKNGLEALNWVYSDQSCADITQTYFESIDFAGNKIFMKKIPVQTKWVKSYKAVIAEVNNLVKANYKCGLSWSSKGEGDVSKLLLNIGNTYKTNFTKQEEKKPEPVEEVDPRLKIQEMITSGQLRQSLKPINKPEVKKEEPKPQPVKTEAPAQQVKPAAQVTPPQQTNTTVTASVCTTSSSKHSNEAKKGRRHTLIKNGKKEIFEDLRKLFIYENIEGETKDLDPEKLINRTVVQISNCAGSVFKVSKKINTIKLDNCEDVTIVCTSLISIFEIVNSVKIRVQVEGTINAFSVDGSSDVILQLSLDSANAQVIASKSSEVRLRLVKEDDKDDYTEHLIPEQFVFTLTPTRKIEAKVSDLYDNYK